MSDNDNCPDLLKLTAELCKFELPDVLNNNKNFVQQIIDFEHTWNKQLLIAQSCFKNKLKNIKKLYDKEFSEYKNTLKNEIQELIYIFHDPDLIDPKASPNDNTIYKLHEDFCITSEKGGWGYGQRSQFLCETPLIMESDKSFKFPIDGKYAIMELKNCITIRDKYGVYLSL